MKNKIALFLFLLCSLAAFAQDTTQHIIPGMVDDKKGLPPNLSGDGVHPTLEGYKMMEPMVEKAIDEALKRKK
jgi:lysophospholipase L1-like esterase